MTELSKYKQQIVDGAEYMVKQNKANQKTLIDEDSPFSDEMNSCILTYEEFYYYYQLSLQEAAVTRKCLISDIDFDMWVTKKRKTNKELMLEGKSPFAYDRPEGEIELHHMGQKYDGPFVELTKKAHMLSGNSNMLHPSKKPSWRNEKALVNKFAKEKSDYWKMRARGEITIVEPKHNNPISKRPGIKSHLMTTNYVPAAIERIFKESLLEDLIHYRNLANNLNLLREAEADSIEDFILKNSSQNNEEYQVMCSFCGSKRYQSYGNYKAAGETYKRFMCKNCGKTFTLFNNSIVAGCTFSILDWLKFIDCLYYGYSINRTAQICNISEKTAHENRLRLFYALKILNDKVKLKENIVIDETYFTVSYKGNHNKNENFIMPRESHQRGGENHAAGLSKEQVCVVCALDDYGNSIARVAGFGAPSSHKLEMVLADTFDEETDICIFSDKEAALNKFAKLHNYQIQQAKLLRPKAKKKNVVYDRQTFVINRYLQRMNAYHSRLKKFVARIGVSSRLLPGYLYLFSWKERNKESSPIEAYKELLTVLTTPNLNKDIKSIGEVLSEHDVWNIEKNSKKPSFKDIKKAEAIYRRYASGEQEQSIAKSYGVSCAAISKTIKKFRRLGLAYKTEKEKAAEIKLEASKISAKKYDYKNRVRDEEIFDAFEKCTSSKKEFYGFMSQKYNLSVGRIKHIISDQKRISVLKEDFKIYDEFKYKNTKELYLEIYNRFLDLSADKSVAKYKIYQIIADETGYKPVGVQTIIDKMIKSGEYNSKRTPAVEVTNRDKALFVDYLKWNKSQKEFCEFASKKYNLSAATVKQILRFSFKAVPERYINKLD